MLNPGSLEFDVMRLEARIDKSKLCKRCGQVLSKVGFSRDKRKPDGLQAECKECHKQRKMQYRYGISQIQKQNLYAAQGCKCAICQKSIAYDGNDAHIAHCHTSGKVRGLLCHSCNVAIGHFGDNIDTLARAILYLDKHAPSHNESD